MFENLTESIPRTVNAELFWLVSDWKNTCLNFVCSFFVEKIMAVKMSQNTYYSLHSKNAGPSQRKGFGCIKISRGQNYDTEFRVDEKHKS